MTHKRTQKQPLVSVVMPVHNGDRYLRSAIDSILNQTYSNFELIIVDDASTDDTWNIIQEYKKKYGRKIKAIQRKRPLGQSGDPATNIAIKRARGEFIAKMDADDISYKNRLETQVAFLQKNPEIFMVGSHADIITKRRRKIGVKKTPVKHNEIYTSFFLYNNMIHPSVMFRNNFENPFYDLTFPYFNEYYTFYKLMNQGKLFANIPIPLIKYRVHGLNDTFFHTKQKFLSTLRIRKAFVQEFEYHPTAKQVMTTIAQAAAVFLLPEKIMIQLYLVSKNVITIEEFITDLLPSPLPSLKRLAYAINK